MPRWLQITLTFVLFAAASREAAAEPRAGEIASALEGSEGAAYLRGLAHGIEWAVTQTRHDSSPPYCPPLKLAIPAAVYRNILLEQIKLHPEKEMQWAGLVLFDGLKQTFPCSQAR